MLIDALLDAFLDTLKLLPFLFVTYLFMEWIEHGASDRFEKSIAKGGRVGPIVGALLGVVPQCGFSGAAATLYAGRVVTLGTLIAVFLATSDEMLPIMISQASEIGVATIVKILAIKVVCGMAFGLIIDLVLSKTGRLHTGLSSKRKHEGHAGYDIDVLCEEEGCDCEDDHDHQGHSHADEHGHKHAHGGIVLPALRHSLNISLFIFIVSLVINMLVEMGLEHALAGITTVPYMSALVAGVFGFIPNCAISVGMTELYIEGLMSGSALVAGLCVNAGVGLLVLFRTNRDFNENLKIMALMLVVGFVIGCGVEALHLL